MKTKMSLLLLLFAVPLLFAQDDVTAAPKNFKVLAENEQVRGSDNYEGVMARWAEMSCR